MVMDRIVNEVGKIVFESSSLVLRVPGYLGDARKLGFRNFLRSSTYRKPPFSDSSASMPPQTSRSVLTDCWVDANGAVGAIRFRVGSHNRSSEEGHA